MKEYNAIKVKWDFELKTLNKVMNDMAKEGWELVCVSPQTMSTMEFVVVFSREGNQ